MTQPPPGWWYGPDGRWYPPAPGPVQPAQPPPRKRRHRVWWILGATATLAVIAVVVLAALTSSDDPVQAKVGQSITLHGQPHQKGVVTVVRIIDPATPGAKFGPDTSGGRYVGVILTVTNTGTVDIGDADLSGSLNDGTYFEAPVGLRDCPQLPSTIRPGQTATACNAFDVLVGATVSDYTLQFNWDGAREGQWDLH